MDSPITSQNLATLPYFGAPTSTSVNGWLSSRMRRYQFVPTAPEARHFPTHDPLFGAGFLYRGSLQRADLRLQYQDEARRKQAGPEHTSWMLDSEWQRKFSRRTILQAKRSVPSIDTVPKFQGVPEIIRRRIEHAVRTNLHGINLLRLSCLSWKWRKCSSVR